MARNSKLTDKQWAEIGKRYLADETGRSLAREFGVSETAIRKRFGSQTKQIKKVANQIVAAEEAFSSLPLSSQISARTLADELRAISTHLAGAAKYGAMTAHHLSGVANFKVQEIDDATPLCEESLEALKGISILTKVANSSAEIGLNLLRANKETVDGLNRDSDKPEPKQIIFAVVDASA